MKVILLEDVKKVGKKNEIVDVSQGYATNVLIKQNKAVEADKKNLDKLDKRKAENKKEYEQEIVDAKKLKEELEAKEFVFTLKANNGQVFGSISHKQIVDELKKQGYKIDKKMLIGEPINHLGYDKVELKLHKEVTAKITVKVEDR